MKHLHNIFRWMGKWRKASWNFLFRLGVLWCYLYCTRRIKAWKVKNPWQLFQNQWLDESEILPRWFQLLRVKAVLWESSSESNGKLPSAILLLSLGSLLPLSVEHSPYVRCISLIRLYLQRVISSIPGGPITSGQQVKRKDKVTIGLGF